jgi:branched-chain amino acid:cation transporter, LIVCS family
MANKKTSAIVSGLALFSMFFGAGNLVFPLVIGQTAGSGVGIALLGLVVTAVLFPLIGLLAMMLYKGSYDSFFGRIGKWPGWVVLLLVTLVQGPPGAVPRLISLSEATLQPFLGGMPSWVFAVLAGGVIFGLSLRKAKIIDLLGSLLTPVLLISLGLIVTLGLIHPPALPAAPASGGALFVDGLLGGYNTLDLIAAFLFAALVMGHFQDETAELDPREAQRLVVRRFVKASFIAAGLLAVVYGGLCLTSAYHGEALQGVAPEALVGRLGFAILGKWGGLVSAVAVAMACLTTAISLTVIFADYIRKYWFRERLSHPVCLFLSVATAVLFANLGFGGIMQLLAPVLAIAYPGLIVLSALNIAHKLYEFRPIKVPVLATFGLATLWHFL